MAWPTTPLDVKVELALGADLSAAPATWTWTDITAYTRIDEGGVRITRGRTGSAQTAAPMQIVAKLDNTDGRFARHNPLGAYYGLLRKNTPMRVSVNPGTGYVSRGIAYVPAWAPEWDPSEQDQWVTVTAYGLLRRIRQGNAPVRSTLRRSIAAAGPVAYWPCEDGGDAIAAASALSNADPLTVTGTVTFEAVDDFIFTGGGRAQYGTLSLPDLSGGGKLSASLPASATAAMASQWSVQCGAVTNPLLTSGDIVLLDWTTPGGTYVRWQLVMTTGLVTQVVATSAAGVATVVCSDGGVTTTFVGHWVSATQNGGNIDVIVHTAHTTTCSGSVAGTLTGPKDITANSTGVTSSGQFPVGHITMFADATPPFEWRTFGNDAYGVSVGGAVNGYDGEATHIRLARCAEEDGVPMLAITAPSADFVRRMSYQPPASAIALYTECEQTELGILYEALTGELGYITREQRYNATAALSLNYAAGHVAPPWRPYDGDRNTRNDITVTGAGGTSARSVDMDSTDPATGVGTYATTYPVNTYRDGYLADIATWLRRLGTNDELQWPDINLDLARSTDLIAAWLALDLGERIHVDGHPSPLTTGTIRLLLEGYSEQISSFTWQLTLNLLSAEPWTVAELDSDTLGKLDSGSSTLTSNITSTATSVSVTTSVAGDLWTTDANELDAGVRGPLYITIGGLIYRCTNITGAASPQTFTIVRLGAGADKAHSAGDEVHTYRPAVLAL